MKRSGGLSLVLVFLLSACGGSSTNWPTPYHLRPPDKAKIDALVAGKEGREAIDAVKWEWFKQTDTRDNNRGLYNDGEIVYAYEVLNREVEEYIAKLNAEAAVDPFVVLPRTEEMIVIALNGMLPELRAKFLAVQEAAAAAHEARAREISDAYPRAKRFHTARAVLLRKKGDLAISQVKFEVARPSLRLSSKGESCPYYSQEINDLHDKAPTDRTADLVIDLDVCKVDLIEQPKEQKLEWDDKVQVGTEHVPIAWNRICGQGKVSAGSETCHRDGNDLVCKKDTMAVAGGCRDVVAATEERPVYETHHKTGSRTVQEFTYSFTIKGTWAA